MTSIACRVAIREGVSVGTPRTDSGLLDFSGFLVKQITHEKLFPYTSRSPFSLSPIFLASGTLKIFPGHSQKDPIGSRGPVRKKGEPVSGKDGDFEVLSSRRFSCVFWLSLKSPMWDFFGEDLYSGYQ